MFEDGGNGSLDVLLVEDDPVIAEMYRLKLVREGFGVRLAGDGPSGLESALERPPDLLLLDIRLPGLDGLELLDRLRGATQGSVPSVIVLSNYAESEDIRRGHTLGVLEHLIKSQTTPALLVEAIRRQLLDWPPAPTSA